MKCNQLILKCSKCFTEHDLTNYAKKTTFEYNRPMGMETEHNFSTGHKCKCGNYLGYDRSIYEYPPGYINHSEVVEISINRIVKETYEDPHIQNWGPYSTLIDKIILI